MPAARTRRRCWRCRRPPGRRLSAPGSPSRVRPARQAPGGTAARPAAIGQARQLTGPSSQDQPPVPQVSLAGLRWSDFYGVELPSSVPAGPR